MKRFLSISLFVVLSILLTPIFSNHYNAVAGRVTQGNVVSPACDCGHPGQCYSDYIPYEFCGYEGYLSRPASSPDTGTTDNKTSDSTSLGLIIFATVYMFRRFLV